MAEARASVRWVGLPCRPTNTAGSDAEIVYGERREHCFTGDTQHPNAVGSRTVHQRYMPAMAQWMLKTAPSGADTKSWVYLTRLNLRPPDRVFT